MAFGRQTTFHTEERWGPERGLAACINTDSAGFTPKRAWTSLLVSPRGAMALPSALRLMAAFTSCHIGHPHGLPSRLRSTRVETKAFLALQPEERL